jgi:hypothetical protein
MPNARQTSLIASPSISQATNRRRSSITEHSFHGRKGERCYPCVGYDLSPMSQAAHVRTTVEVAHNPSVQMLPVGAVYVVWTDVGAIRLIVL